MSVSFFALILPKCTQEYIKYAISLIIERSKILDRSVLLCTGGVFCLFRSVLCVFCSSLRPTTNQWQNIIVGELFYCSGFRVPLVPGAERHAVSDAQPKRDCSCKFLFCSEFAHTHVTSAPLQTFQDNRR